MIYLCNVNIPTCIYTFSEKFSRLPDGNVADGQVGCTSVCSKLHIVYLYHAHLR